MLLKPTFYTTTHIEFDPGHSEVIAKAFCEGSGARIKPTGHLLPGPAIVHGILRGCGEIIKACEWIDRDYYHIDHGYMKRGYYDGYFRVSKNGLQADWWSDENAEKYPADRFRSMGVKPTPWKKNGTHIVFAPIATAVANLRGIHPGEWNGVVRDEIKRWTDRPVVVKEKQSDVPIGEALKDAWCLVTYSSNTAIDAILAGIPTVVLGPSAAEPVSWGLSDIEVPHYPDIEPWLNWLAYQQWTLEEMKRGECWAYVKGL